jgi:hypothetical protein
VDATEIYDTYQWQVNKNDGYGFVNVGSVITATFSGSPEQYTATYTLPTNLGSSTTGWIYRIVLASNSTDLTSPLCYYLTPQTLIIAACDVVLSVDFNSIHANLINNIPVIHWQVSEQLNVSHYELERSTNGRDFSYVSSIEALPTPNYIASDPSASLGTNNYYRIKEVNNDGTFAYSTIVNVFVPSSSNTVNVMPNPATNNITISIPVNNSIHQAIIYNAIGQEVYQSDYINSNTLSIDVSNFASGFYDAKIFTNNNQILNAQFIKKD